MKRIVSLVLTAVLCLGCFSLTGCGDKRVTIKVFNWGEYISDGAEGSLDVIKLFEEKYNIKVIYTNYDTNEAMYSKIKNSAGEYDVIIPSDYMAAKLIKEDLLEKLDYKNIPNYADVFDSFKGENAEYDPTNSYTVPYTWGTVGIVYNQKMVSDPVDSWDILWNEKYKEQILMFNNSRDALGISLKRLGYSMNSTNENEIKQAAEELKKQKPLVQAYVMDQIFDKMENNEAALGTYYAGDAVTMMDSNPDLNFAFPEEGVNRFVDVMCIPKGSKNKEAAEKFIDFMTSAEISKANVEYLGYCTPSKKAFDLLDDEIKDNKIIYPEDAVLDQSEIFTDLPQETLDLHARLWSEVKAYKP